MKSKKKVYDECTLYDEIIKTWGEFGWHADVYRELLKRASEQKDCMECDMIKPEYKAVLRAAKGDKR